VTSNTPPTVRHRLIVRHPYRQEILTDSGGLPRLVTEERHTAEVDYINAAVTERLGLRTAVLRSLSHSDVVDGVVDRVHELEALQEDGLASATLQWRPLEDVGAFDDPLDRRAFQNWRESDFELVDGREWTRVGWFAAVRVWIEESLQRAGFGVPVDIVQLRTWATSTVLSVRTPSGDYYFKALPESGRVEGALTHYLAQRFPDAMPRIIAAEPDRRWLLMAACPGRTLEDIADVTVWERAQWLATPGFRSIASTA
jgi:hypothetical protein